MSQWYLAALVAVGLGLGSCSVTDSPQRGVWFDDLVGIAPPSEAELREAIRCLGSDLFETGRCDGLTEETPRPRIVFLSLADGRRPATVVLGAGRGLKEALFEAMVAARSALLEGSGRAVKVDFVTQVGAPAKVGRKDSLEVERGYDGLAFDRGTGLAFLPEEVVARTLVNSDREVRARNVEKYLGSVSSGRLDNSESLWRGEVETVRTFRTASFFVGGGEVEELERGHPRFRDTSPEAMLEAAIAAGEYLRTAVTENGRFVYSYLPKTDREKDEYNILRHAGSVYSMLELVEVTGDEELMASVRKALGFLRSQVQNCSPPGTPQGRARLCVVEDGYVKLGGNALAVLALAKYAEVSGDRTDLPLMQGLARWMTGVQGEDGEFEIHKLDVTSGVADDFVSGYYPGEALFALVRLFRLDTERAWLEAADAGARFLIEVRDAGLDDSELSHDHWLLYALTELYDSAPRSIFAEHSGRLAAVIVDSQNREPDFPDWKGSYYEPPRSTPTATRTEGLCAAFELATATGRPGDAILEAARLGIDFQLQSQFGPESVLYLPDPSRAIGGFHRSLTDFEIRIDYVQHNLSSLLCVSRLLGSVPAR